MANPSKVDATPQSVPTTWPRQHNLPSTSEDWQNWPNQDEIKMENSLLRISYHIEYFDSEGGKELITCTWWGSLNMVIVLLYSDYLSDI